MQFRAGAEGLYGGDLIRSRLSLVKPAANITSKSIPNPADGYKTSGEERERERERESERERERESERDRGDSECVREDKCSGRSQSSVWAQNSGEQRNLLFLPGSKSLPAADRPVEQTRCDPPRPAAHRDPGGPVFLPSVFPPFLLPRDSHLFVFL